MAGGGGEGRQSTYSKSGSRSIPEKSQSFLSCLITALGEKDHCFPFTIEETEAQRGQASQPKTHSKKLQSEDGDPI